MHEMIKFSLETHQQISIPNHISYICLIFTKLLKTINILKTVNILFVSMRKNIQRNNGVFGF
jgi:hypothetical protein